MRPGNQSNKRMRGRGRKGPNPLTRTYESNGPDVKIRGTAMHIAEKYQQLARDAQASGDRVMFENYNQHAEHYLRIVAAAQPQQQPSAQPFVRGEAEDGQEAAQANGAANGAERPATDQPAPDGEVVDTNSPQPFIDNMPVINQEGRLNGADGQAEAEGEQVEEKPRRRARTPRTASRGRPPRRAAPEAQAENGAEAAAELTAEADATSEEAPKPRRRTATRTRRPKAVEEAPAEPASASD